MKNENCRSKAGTSRLIYIFPSFCRICQQVRQILCLGICLLHQAAPCPYNSAALKRLQYHGRFCTRICPIFDFFRFSEISASSAQRAAFHALPQAQLYQKPYTAEKYFLHTQIKKQTRTALSAFVKNYFRGIIRSPEPS